MGLWAATSRAFSQPKAGEFAQWCDPRVTSAPSKIWILRSATATLANRLRESGNEWLWHCLLQRGRHTRLAGRFSTALSHQCRWTRQRTGRRRRRKNHAVCLYEFNGHLASPLGLPALEEHAFDWWDEAPEYVKTRVLAEKAVADAVAERDFPLSCSVSPTPMALRIMAQHLTEMRSGRQQKVKHGTRLQLADGRCAGCGTGLSSRRDQRAHRRALRDCQ